VLKAVPIKTRKNPCIEQGHNTVFPQIHNTLRAGSVDTSCTEDEAEDDGQQALPSGFGLAGLGGGHG